MRNILLCLAAVYVFGAFCVMIIEKEALRRSAATVYLVLAPRDPRSLMQGDYMELSYDVTNAVNHLQLDDDAKAPKVPATGVLVISLDDQGVGHFARLYHGEALAPNEHLLRFHHQDWFAVIGAEKYFIPEGSGHAFEGAIYGELKVASDGTPLLVALCDKDRQPISLPDDGASP